MDALNLTPEEWLVLLELRTIGDAYSVVSRASSIGEQDPCLALQFIWKHFDRRFLHSQPREVGQLLARIQAPSCLSSPHLESLWVFILDCNQALGLLESDPVHPLQVLNFPNTQLRVTERLDPVLWERWTTHAFSLKERYPVSLPFREFIEWISGQAEMYSSPDLVRQNRFLSSLGDAPFNSSWSLSAQSNRILEPSASSSRPSNSSRPFLGTDRRSFMPMTSRNRTGLSRTQTTSLSKEPWISSVRTEPSTEPSNNSTYYSACTIFPSCPSKQKISARRQRRRCRGTARTRRPRTLELCGQRTPVISSYYTSPRDRLTYEAWSLPL